MKVTFTSCFLAILFLSTNASADLWCSKSYRFESYPFGVAAGLGNLGLSASPLDEVCFKLGKEYAHELLGRYAQERTCLRAFDEGTDDGLGGEIGSADAGALECYTAGNNFGFSKLSVLARKLREETVGHECVAEYKRGKSDGMNYRVSTPSSDSKEKHCYETGYSDGSFFGNSL